MVEIDGRAPVRARLPWEPPSEEVPAAGFSTGRPWLPLVEDAERLCVQRQLDDADSLLSLVRRLAWRRRHDPCLQRGEQRSVNAGEGILGYLRELEGDTLLVLLNFEAQAGRLNHRDLPERATVELCTHGNREPETVSLSDLQLRPNEGLLLRPLVASRGYGGRRWPGLRRRNHRAS